MHELGLILELVSLAESALARAGGGTPERLNLSVGVLSGASPEALAAAFSVVAPQRGWTGAELAICEVPALGRCPACGLDREVREPFLDCPACGGPLAVEGGRELRLDSIDVAD